MNVPSDSSAADSSAADPVAVSVAEHDASAQRLPPRSEVVAPGVTTIALPLPEGPNVPYTLAYLIADAEGAPHLIDPGWDSPENEQRIERALADQGWTVADLRTITVTHLHGDHLGLADVLRERSGARVVLHRAEQAAIDALVEASPTRVERVLAQADQWDVPADRVAELTKVAERSAHIHPFTTDALVDDGDLLDIPGRRIRVVHTPGHTPGHMTLVDDTDPTARLVFTGDHVLPTVHGGLGLGGETARNALAEVLDSLRRVAQLDGNPGDGPGGSLSDGVQVCPGHEYRFRGLAARCAAIEEHHLGRSQEIAEARDELDDPTVYAIASRVHWSPGWENMRGFVLLSALQQTAMHLEFLLEEDL